jgi:hypothetical protein
MMTGGERSGSVSNVYNIVFMCCVSLILYMDVSSHGVDLIIATIVT